MVRSLPQWGKAVIAATLLFLLAVGVDWQELPAHLARLPAERRERFAAAVIAGVRLPLDYVRLNVSALRAPT